MNKIFEKDGAYTNLVTGMGDASMDKDESTTIKPFCYNVNYERLATQYARDGIVRRIAEQPVIKALKSPITINDDPKGDTFKALAALGFFQDTTKAGTWARLLGGAIVVTLYENDGEDVSRPPRPGAKIAGYRVFSIGRTMVTEADFVEELDSPYFGKVEVWPLRLRSGKVIRVHDSRCTLFRGVQLPDVLDCDVLVHLFGCSEVEMVNQGLLKLPTAFASLSNMLQENGLSIYSLDGLSSMLAEGDCGVRKVRERMGIVKLGMSTMRAVFQDKNDAFDMKSHSLGDVPESIKMLFAYVSALCGIPVSILFGNMVSGLSSTNEGDIRQMDDLVEQWRQQCLYKPMCRMITDFRNRNENKPGEHDFQFGGASQLSDKEKSELRKNNADTAQILYNMGCFTAREIRENMLVNGGSFDFTVKSAEIPKNEAPAKEERT